MSHQQDEKAAYVSSGAVPFWVLTVDLFVLPVIVAGAIAISSLSGTDVAWWQFPLLAVACCVSFSLALATGVRVWKALGLTVATAIVSVILAVGIELMRLIVAYLSGDLSN